MAGSAFELVYETIDHANLKQVGQDFWIAFDVVFGSVHETRKSEKLGVGFWMLDIVCPRRISVHRGNTPIAIAAVTRGCARMGRSCSVSVSVPQIRGRIN